MDPNRNTSPNDRQHQDRPEMSDEDARQLVEQLRSTPPEHIITDVFSILLQAAQVKLGRRDARLFIDLCAVMLQHARGHLSEEIGRQVEQALGDLRLAQVSAENQVTSPRPS